MAASTTATALWAKVTADIRRTISSFTDRKQVIERDGNAVIVASHDPNAQVQKRISKLRGLPVDPGDDILTIQLGGKEIAIGALLKPGEVDMADYIQGFDGDGSSTYAARADHEHLPASGNTQGMELGIGASATLRGMAIGRGTLAADAALGIGISANAGGYVSVSIGFTSQALGEYGVGIGYNAKGNGARSVAVGHAAEAGDYAVAIGGAAGASATGSTAIGYNAQASGTRAIAIGYNANETRADVAKIKANELWLERSSGSGLTRVVVYSPNGTAKQIRVNDDDSMLIGSTTIRGGGVEGVLPHNRKIGSAAAPLKSYPSNNAGGIAMPAGRAFHYSGTVSNEGYTWYVVWSNYGVGYIRSDLTVAL